MNNLIEEIQRRALITPEDHRAEAYLEPSSNFEDDLREALYKDFMQTNPSYEEQQRYIEQEYLNDMRDKIQTFQQPEPFDLDQYFREYNKLNGLSPYEY